MQAKDLGMDHDDEKIRLKVRTVWISDLHLGTPGCQAVALLKFLRDTHCDTLYLVGDIIDGWQLRRSWYWPQSHNDVVQKILRKARKGTKVIFVPGNHDEFARRYLNAQLWRRRCGGRLHAHHGRWETPVGDAWRPCLTA
jgi:predicted MPP superfamily phosphohydrolase